MNPAAPVSSTCVLVSPPVEMSGVVVVELAGPDRGVGVRDAVGAEHHDLEVLRAHADEQRGGVGDLRAVLDVGEDDRRSWRCLLTDEDVDLPSAIQTGGLHLRRVCSSIWTSIRWDG